jgi:hypothetical protein
MALTRLGLNQAVNLATNVTGTLATGNGGTGATSFAPGKVLQVVSATSVTSVSTTSSSYVTTGLSASITPSATTSKIFITLQGCADNDGGGRQGYFAIFRDSTNLNGGAISASTSIYSGDRIIVPVATSHLDSPSSTSSLTYALYFKNPGSDSVEFLSQSTQAHITLMEIGA